MLLKNPLIGCFFCRPEPWRTIYIGRHVQLLAGAGPLCPGYCIVAPREHIHSVAELPNDSLLEFLSVFEILKKALANQYGPGYTAYEHGRVGACRVLEVSNDLSTFCHHAHRVVIPVSTELASEIAVSFDHATHLEFPNEITRFNRQEYVYYETANRFNKPKQICFTGQRGIPSQFMRRIITNALGLGREWNWASDLNYEEMIETVGRLRSEFMGLETIDESPITEPMYELRNNISIDGYTCAGKTTIATYLARMSKRPVLDTGLIFRFMAFAKLSGFSDPDITALKQELLDPRADVDLASTSVIAEASKLASDPVRRKVFSDLTRELLSELQPCIVIGRDTWRYVSDTCHRLLIEADFETRVKRRFLLQTASEMKLGDLRETEDRTRRSDSRDEPKLPPDSTPSLLRVNNGRRPLSSVIREIILRVGGTT